ncbi:TatD family hydrolase [archaeon]|jgi:TatD DNase family protein|nr:TatD family hydrolase [archaeon]MBT7128269.1 TatD family hydrolase [archaeon]
MKLVDVHCHLNDSRFDVDRDEVLARFKEKGGEIIVTSGVNPESNRESLKLAERYDVVRACFGIYPTDALAAEVESGESNELLRELKEFDLDEELAWIEAHAGDCVAVGEIGLDYNFKEFQTEEMREKQKVVFRKCLRMAKRIGKSVVVHSRKAELDAIDILEEEKMVSVIMHCFNGKKALIRRCVENGWSFSVPAVIARLDHFKMLVDMVPMELLLTETDGAYLAPVAGTRNEPVNVMVTLEEIARIKGLDVEEVSERIFENTKGLFEF